MSARYDRCPVCSEQFPSAVDRVYCGPRCRKIAHRARMNAERDELLRLVSGSGPDDPIQQAAAALVRAARAAGDLDTQRRCDGALRVLVRGPVRRA